MTRHLWWLPLLAAACAAGSPQPSAPWLAPAVAGHTITEPLPSPFDVRLKDGGTASLATCADLVRLDARITEEISGNNVNGKAFQSTRVQCQALAAVAMVRPARQSLLPTAPETHGLAAALEAGAPASFYLAISDDSQLEVQRAQEAALTLKQFRPDTHFRQATADTVRIDVDDTIQDVQLLARGDFNADGIEDWLLRIDSRVAQGSYGTSSLWLITSQGADRPLSVLKRWP